MLSPGSTFAGYEVESVVGAGGFGVLYRARQVRLDRPVALKLVEPDVARDPVIRERLRREARTVAALDHPNVVPLYEAGEEGGTVYVVTRWVDGTELGTLIMSEGSLEPRRAARIAAQIAAALEGAHEKGLVHRDVKPSNVILTHEDHAYLTDFGLAKRAATAPGLTAADQMLGTVDYVAPESIEGGEPDAPSDVYSLGCVLFEMLTGEPPFADQKGGMAKMWAQVNAEPPSVRKWRSDVPPALEDVMRRAMAKVPEARPTAAAFRVGVLEAGGELPWSGGTL
jgi:serine/threonine protein kinase